MAFHLFVWGKTFDPVEVLAIIAHFLVPFLINLAYSLIIKAEKVLTRGIRNVTDCVLLYTFLNQATVSRYSDRYKGLVNEEAIRGIFALSSGTDAGDKH